MESSRHFNGSGTKPCPTKRSLGDLFEDVSQTLSVALVCALPFGGGQRWLNKGGIVGKLVGGWAISNIFRAQTGTPLYFRSSTCNVPSQFDLGCIPAILPGANPWAQSKSNFDPSKPLFNVNAFEPASSFNFYYGKGPRMTNLRGFGYHNHDFALMKNTHVSERVGVQFRGEFFNVWNWHCFTYVGEGANEAFITDIASPSFGMWNGNVSTPRNIQFTMKVLF